MYVTYVTGTQKADFYKDFTQNPKFPLNKEKNKLT